MTTFGRLVSHVFSIVAGDYGPGAKTIKRGGQEAVAGRASAAGGQRSGRSAALPTAAPLVDSSALVPVPFTSLPLHRAGDITTWGSHKLAVAVRGVDYCDGSRRTRRVGRRARSQWPLPT